MKYDVVSPCSAPNTGTCTPTQIEPGNSITYKIACVLSECSDQPAHPHSLIRVFAEHSVGTKDSKTSSGGERNIRPDCA